MKQFSALIPAYNEAGSIAATVAALKEIPAIAEVIVINDGSTDNTAEIALAQGARVFHLSENRGKGEAVWRGARIARQSFIALADADLGDSARDIQLLMDPLLQDQADMAIAVFPPRDSKGGFGLVKTLSSRGIRILGKKRFTEPLSGQRVFPAQLLKEMEKPPRGFGLEVALTLKALRRGYRISEVPVNMRHRERGRDISSFLHRGRQFTAVSMELWRGLWDKLLNKI